MANEKAAHAGPDMKDQTMRHNIPTTDFRTPPDNDRKRRSRDALPRWCRAGAVAFVMVVTVVPAHADDEQLRGEELEVAAEDASQDANEDGPQFENIYAEMNLEQLMNIQVESVAGIAQDWFTTPAAIYTIDGEAISRNGHQHLAEVLRMVPGMHVARINSKEWAVSARGFNGQFANKLQVLIDGREVYDPIFAGVRWKFQDLVLDDVKQIEVIRGPGATLWGANAVNGVVNIETKSARQTQGLYLKEVVGTELRNITALRYGGQISEDTHYRVWGKYTSRDAGEPPDGVDEFDDWRIAHGGFRIDHQGTEHTTLTLNGGGFYSDQLGDRFSVPGTAPFSTTTLVGDNLGRGGHLVGRLKRDNPDGSGWTVTTSTDYVGRRTLSGFEEDLFTTNLDWRHHFDLSERQRVIWGAGYRLMHYDTDSEQGISFEPDHDTLHLFSAFVQDTITLKPDRWHFMVGSKFEHNDLSGFEIQPSARLWWTPDERQTFWGAVSRAVRRPSVTDKHINLELFPTGAPPPNDMARVRGDDVEAENLLAYELGYRRRLTDNLLIDTTVFYNQYDDLIEFESQGFNFTATNDGEAESYGLETAVQWQPARNVHLTGSYSLLRLDARGPDAEDLEAEAPTHQFQIRGDLDVTDDLALHGSLYFVDDVDTIPSYWRLDSGLTWRINNQVDLALWGQNLLDSSHPEFTASSTTATETERSAFLQLRCRF